MRTMLFFLGILFLTTPAFAISDIQIAACLKNPYLEGCIRGEFLNEQLAEKQGKTDCND